MFVVHMVFVAAAHFYHFRVKIAIGNTQRMGLTAFQ